LTKLRRTFYAQIERASFRTAWVALRRASAVSTVLTDILRTSCPLILDIPVFGQLAPLQLPFGDALEPRP